MKKRFSKVMHAVIFLSVLTSIVIMMPLVKAQTLSLSSSQGAVGSTVTLSVSGFAASETVDFGISLNIPNPQIESIGSITANSNGYGSISVTVPNVAATQYTISAVGQTSGDTATEPFTVTASTTATPIPTVTPTPATVVSPSPTIPEFPNQELVTGLVVFMIIVLSAVIIAKKRKTGKIQRT